MEFVLLLDRSVPSEQVSDIIDLAFLFDEMRSADNVDVILHSQVSKQADVIFCILGNSLHRQAR